MLTKSKKQKGKQLEKFVASYLDKIFKFAYSRADSGSGKYKKEDISLPDEAPFFIECKNQAMISLGSWWKQTLYHCPKNKIPVLIYKLNYQKDPTVYMFTKDYFEQVLKTKTEAEKDRTVSFPFSHFIDCLTKSYAGGIH